MNRIFFGLDALYYWADDAVNSKRLKSLGNIIISDNEALDKVAEASADQDIMIDPDVRELLESLRDSGYSICLCDSAPMVSSRSILRKLNLIEMFDEVCCAKTPQTTAKALKKWRTADDFCMVVGDSEVLIEGARLCQMPSIAYGASWKDRAETAFAIARYPLEIEDQVNMCVMVHEVVKKALLKKTRILGIDGIDFAGKKIFANKVVKYLGLIGMKSTIINLEDFHRSVEVSYRGEDPVEAYYFNGYNNEKLIKEILDPFLANGSLDVELYCVDGTDNQFNKERIYQLDKGSMMIVLGTMMFREPLLSFFDTKIYMRVDYREAEHRASLIESPIYGEDPLEVYRTKNIPAQKMYVQKHDPFIKSDFVIDNSNYHRPFFMEQ